MTDIRQHLPEILSCLRHHLSMPRDNRCLLQQDVQAALTRLLPTSYGIGTGLLANIHEQRSHPIDIIVYDKTITPGPWCAGAPMYDIRQALLVILLANELDTSALHTLLQGIASVKMLRPASQKHTTQTATKATRIAKKLFPLGILAFQSLTDIQTRDQEKLCLTLDAILKRQDAALRPDYLIAQTYNLSYTTPLLHGDTFEQTTINIAREPNLTRPHPCYICKQKFARRHFFYEHLCLRCGDLNYQKRAIRANLAGRVALVTGARVKIGYATAVRLLRAGAHVIATTRFPCDAARRYSSEPDFDVWRDKLQIYGLDFRYLPVLEHFIAHLHTTNLGLDTLINNAAQTVWRPPAYYATLLANEQASLSALPPEQQALIKQLHPVVHHVPFALSEGQGSIDATPHISATHDVYAANTASLFPPGHYDEHQQQIDLRPQNSWNQGIDEISLTEFLEVQVINVTAPFLLISQLRPLLRRSPFPQRFIVNVSAAEGQFAQEKLGTHPHTNMAKAALNMLTHSTAADLARDNIFMNNVDPGWVSQQAPITDPATRKDMLRLMPLDMVDAAARVCDPIFMSLSMGKPPYGQFYKDYRPVAW
ncbi:SDR family NAD(P)-dependent oxidoreductase [Ktedonospora formicarum]|uniref:Oxidoreductase n=1 Tax=Ktedonospora formicarum TaxID=2778364 RepID=A0A8J3I8C9_9CHLR|nr:SDR family NAD(P)-dependent oxidoreductase [Ktedonospora formicarum]GHO47269.1 hypothetical protein KSX_54320 [Ktedonospora formicarum]